MTAPGPPEDPYSSLEPVQHLDKMLDGLDRALDVVRSSDRSQFSDIQAAVLDLIPAACSIASSIRVMIREGYLVSALILFRPLMERIATLCYLEQNPAALPLWQAGWAHSTRPSLKTRLGAVMPGSPQGLVDQLAQAVTAYNSLVHGDPLAAKQSLTFSYDGPDIGIAYALGRDYGNLGRANAIASETGVAVAILSARIGPIFRQP